jgi:hypothetical protein
MSSGVSLMLEAIPRGAGFVLDLGGGTGMLRQSLQGRGHRNIKLDSRRFEHGEPSFIKLTGRVSGVCGSRSYVNRIISRIDTLLR